MKRPLAIIIRVALTVSITFFLAYFLVRTYQDKRPIDYQEHLDEKVFTVDGEDLSLRDIAFYVIYEEYNVEKDAMVYNPKNTRDYWNVHTNGHFLSVLAKEAVQGMAIHDHIFYREAVKNNMVLTEEEKKRLDNSRTDFWEDLFESQKENLIAPEEDINRTMYEIALSEKYQEALAAKEGKTYHSLDWNGTDFEEIKNSHDIKVNNRLWNRINLGNITLVHGPADFTPYINREDE